MAEIKNLQTALLSKTQEVQEQLKEVKEQEARTASSSQKMANANVASEMIKVGPILTLPCMDSVW